MKNYCVSSKKVSLFLSLTLCAFLTTLGVKAQQAIGVYPNIDAGFENQNAAAGTGSSLPVGNPNTSATQWSYVSSGNGQVRLVSATGGYGGPKYLSVGKNNPTTNTSTTVNSNIISTGTFTQSTKYVVQFHYKQNLGTPDTLSYVFVSMDGTSGARDTGRLRLGTPTSWTKYTKIITTNGVTTPTSNGVCGINVRLTGTADGATSGVIDVDNFVVYPADNQASPAPDVTAPGAPTALTATSGPAVVNLTWTAPAGGVDGGGYVVVRYTVDPSAEAGPVQNAVYKALATNTVGTTGVVVYVGNANTFSDGSATPGTNYWYKVYAADKAFNYSASAPTSASVSPLTKLNYYYGGTGATDNVNNWWSNKNFTGTHPANFTNPGLVFRIITNADLVSTLSITGVGSSLIIGDPTPVAAPVVTFNSANLPGIDTIYQSTGQITKLYFNTSSVPSINQLVDIATEVHYRADGSTVASSKEYFRMYVENNANVVFSGSPIVVDSFRVDLGSSATLGTLSTRWLTVRDGGTVLINGKIVTPKLVGLVSSGAATSSSGGGIQFEGVENLILGANSTVEYSGISVNNTQNITPRTDYKNLTISGVGVSKTMIAGTTFSGTLTINTSGATGLILQTPVTINTGLTLTKGKINTDATNILTLGASATLTGGSDSSYVVGPMLRNVAGTSTYMFPLGKGGRYRPAAVTPSAATASTFRGEFYNNAYTTTAFNAPLTSIDTTYWSITRTTGTVSAAVTLYTDSTLVPNASAASELVVAFDSSSRWVSKKATAINPSTSLSGSAKSTVLSTFGTFTLGLKPASTVPVTLVSFKGSQQNGKVLLNWTTENEINMNSFVVEESKDGAGFNRIGQVAARNLSRANDYTFTSSLPSNNVTYYRIKMIQNDGVFSYSNIVTIKNEVKKRFAVLGNPVNNNILVFQTAGFSKGLYQIQIIGLGGQLIQQQKIMLDETPLNQQLILNNSVSKGVYFVRIAGNNTAETERIIIQ